MRFPTDFFKRFRGATDGIIAIIHHSNNGLRKKTRLESCRRPQEKNSVREIIRLVKYPDGVAKTLAPGHRALNLP